MPPCLRYRLEEVVMPQVISCPECERSLRVPDDLLGKMVRCPSCKATFTAESGPDKEPQARPLKKPREGDEDEEEPADDRTSTGRGRRTEEEEDVEERPKRRRRAAAEDEDEDQGEDDEMEELAHRRGRRSPRGSRGDWLRVKQGLGFVLAATYVIIGSILVVICGSFVAGAAAGAAAAGKQAGGAPNVAALGAGFLVVMGLYLLGLLAAIVLHVVGLIYCLAAPEYRSGRVLAKVALGLFAGYLAATVVGMVLAFVEVGLVGVNPAGMFQTTGLRLGLSIAGNLASLGHAGVLIFFFRSLALALREEGLARNAVYFFVYYIAFFVFAVVGTLVLVLTLAKEMGDVLRGPPAGGGFGASMGVVIAVSCILFILGMGMVIWYIITLVMTRGAITRATRY
jgi:predicted Zn finger-like uncharacterized protein